MDLEAEDAIKRAFKDYERPHNRVTIPQRAVDELDDPVHGTGRIYGAVEDMVGRGVLTAPIEPWKDWELHSPDDDDSPAEEPGQ
jgi:hypothetical protein